MKKIALSIICLTVLMTCLSLAQVGGAMTVSNAQVDGQEVAKSESTSCLGDLTVLMYHNTLAAGKKQSVYCINQNNLRKDFQYLKDNCYNVISCAYLLECVDFGVPIPDKAVILTFDDGYLNNVTYALPLLEEYGYSGLFSVVGDYTLLDKRGGKGAGDFIYLGWQDIEQAAQNKCVEIGLHSYSMHNTSPRMGVGKLSGESDEEYREVIRRDTQRLADKLSELGVTTDIYAYPYGKYTKISESVLQDMGIAMTLTCNEGINHIYGRRSLYLLKRINRDATKGGLADILRKYE